MFSVIHDIQTAANNLSKDLERISNWATQWKVNFNLYTIKDAQEFPPKHLGIILENPLKSGNHMKMAFRKISKTKGLLRQLHNFLPRSALITIYQAFIRPHLDYGDILCDQAYNMYFHQKLESIHYNACLAIKEKLYHEIGLEPLQL